MYSNACHAIDTLLINFRAQHFQKIAVANVGLQSIAQDSVVLPHVSIRISSPCKGLPCVGLESMRKMSNRTDSEIIPIPIPILSVVLVSQRNIMIYIIKHRII